MTKRPTDKVIQGYFDDLLNDNSDNSWAGKKPAVVSHTSNKSEVKPSIEAVISDVKTEMDAKKSVKLDGKLEAKSTVSSLVQTRITKRVGRKNTDTNHREPPSISPVSNQNLNVKPNGDKTADKKHTDEKGASLHKDSLAEPTSLSMPKNTKPKSTKGEEKTLSTRPITQLQQELQEESKDHALLETKRREKLQQLLDRQTISDLMPTEVDTKKTDISVDTKVKTETKVEEKVIEQKAAPAPTLSPTQIPTQTQSDLEIETQDTTEQEVGNALMHWAKNGRPMWAQETFDVLLFEVSGLSLAVPLVALGQILTMDDKLTVLSGQSEWFMGILPSHAGDIRTVNTSLFVMPERHKEGFENDVKYVVTIDGLPWGLAVDSVNQPITLNPEDVKWREQRSKRPWLAGTVKSHMCALIDIPQMAHLLEQCDKNRAN